MSNLFKREKRFKNEFDFAFKNHPSYADIKMLYLNNVVKNIKTAYNIFNKIKLTKKNIIFKSSIKKFNEIRQMVIDLIAKKEQEERDREELYAIKQKGRTLESYFDQINKSIIDEKFILTEIQQQIFKKKILQDKYVVGIEYNGGFGNDQSGGYITYHTINSEYVDGLIDIFVGQKVNVYEDVSKVSYSDGMYDAVYSAITKFIFSKADSDQFIDDKNGAFFNYLNISKLDLTRYQIIRKEDDAVKINKKQCLLHCFELMGISMSEINSIALSMPSSYIPKNALKNISSIIKKQIVIHLYESKRTNVRKQIYGKQYNETIDIAMFKSHFFIYEETIYNKYFIDNYEKLQNVDNCNDIIRMSKGYYERGIKRCDSLYLVHKMFENGYFIKDTSIITSLVGSKIIDSIPLDNIENEQKEHTLKNKIETDRDIFYADCESDVSNGNHSVLMMGVVRQTDKYKKEPKIFIVDDTGPKNLISKFFSYISKNCKFSGVPIIYFHNLKYDYMGLIKQYLVIKSECSKNNQIYSVKAFHYNFEFELRDSYKLINIKLSKFPSTFGLSINKQEAIAYKFYNKDNIQSNKHSVIQYIDSFDIEKDKQLFVKILNENRDLFEYDGLDTFNASKYYQYYLTYDCLVLRGGIEKYVSIIDEITGTNNKEKLHLHDSLTISSLTNRYMGINGAFDNIYTVSSNLREYISNAIYGGRVNVCEQFKKQIIKEDINDYDATSLYPSAIYRMCKEMGIPQGTAKKIERFNIRDDYFIGRFRITKINKKQQNPFIAVKTKSGINYINEIIEPIIVSIDKITLEDYIEFHQIEYEFIDGVFWNEGFNKKMGDLIYELFVSRVSYKQQMKKLDSLSDEYSKCNILQEIIKLMMNSSYGKTILKKTNEKTTFVYNTGKNKIKNKKRDNYICNNFNTIKSYLEINDTQTQITENCIDTSFNLAFVGVLILSYSKRIMNEVMSVASDNSIDIYYQDTDSMHLKNKDISRLEELFFNKYKRCIRGDNFGEFHSDFKLNGAKSNILSKKSIFLGKKSYIDLLESTNDKGEIINGYHMRMKGISEDALKYASETYFNNDYFKLYEYLSEGNQQEFILNPYKYSVSFEYIKNGIRSRNYQEFKRICKF
jgi:hypothetical protein